MFSFFSVSVHFAQLQDYENYFFIGVSSSTASHDNKTIPVCVSWLVTGDSSIGVFAYYENGRISVSFVSYEL